MDIKTLLGWLMWNVFLGRGDWPVYVLLDSPNLPPEVAAAQSRVDWQCDGFRVAKRHQFAVVYGRPAKADVKRHWWNWG